MDVGKKTNVSILAVCGMGLGSGVVLKMTIDKVLKELGVKAAVNVSDVSSAKSQKADIVVTSPEFASSFKNADVKLVLIKNYVDVNEMKQKLSEALQEL
ncbi:PTS sugar transporter subunit IIB [Coprothermobacter platensis]|uniref:PTS sugar transporter subunit IIB n=1 Tax=Coprothermobacter platensis TaxID=108819 RepID=UPI00036500AB|nr:PTS sugar transporter subunit IIB [Coprothermobacter platensis]